MTTTPPEITAFWKRFWAKCDVSSARNDVSIAKRALDQANEVLAVRLERLSNGSEFLEEVFGDVVVEDELHRGCEGDVDESGLIDPVIVGEPPADPEAGSILLELRNLSDLVAKLVVIVEVHCRGDHVRRGVLQGAHRSSSTSVGGTSEGIGAAGSRVPAAPVSDGAR